MTERPDALQALVDTLNYEREVRVRNLVHAIKSLRGTALMLDGLMWKGANEQTFQALEAVQINVNDIKLWMEEQLKQEVELQASANEEGEDKTIH